MKADDGEAMVNPVIKKKRKIKKPFEFKVSDDTFITTKDNHYFNSSKDIRTLINNDYIFLNTSGEIDNNQEKIHCLTHKRGCNIIDFRVLKLDENTKTIKLYSKCIVGDNNNVDTNEDVSFLNHILSFNIRIFLFKKINEMEKKKMELKEKGITVKQDIAKIMGESFGDYKRMHVVIIFFLLFL